MSRKFLIWLTSLVGIALAAVLLLTAFGVLSMDGDDLLADANQLSLQASGVVIPDDYILTWGPDFTEYVGGDAYNIQIAASIRSGHIAGETAAKASYASAAALAQSNMKGMMMVGKVICLAMGCLLLVLSLMNLTRLCPAAAPAAASVAMPAPATTALVPVKAEEKDGGWVCSKCQTYNLASAHECKDCGKKR